MNTTSLYRHGRLVLAGAGLVTIVVTGCDSPVKSRSERELRDAVTRATEQELADSPRRDITLEPAPSDLAERFQGERLDELERMGGPNSYELVEVMIGEDLNGLPVQGVRVSLREAVLSAVEHNLGVQIASVSPSIAESQIAIAESRFDAVWTGTLNWEKLDQPAVTPVVGGVPVSAGVSARESVNFTTGIEKRLISGGTAQIATGVSRVDNQAPGVTSFPDPSYLSNIQIGLTQPLLEGFGSEVALAEIRLERNSTRSEIEEFRNALIETVQRTEAAYWNLVLARQALRIRERLLDRGSETRDKLIAREDYDVESAQISDALTRVQTREVDVLRARTEVLRASDELKQLMNAPELSVGSEMMIVPTDAAPTDPMTFNLVDAILTGVRRRPEIRQALLSIDDASIRQMLADNLRLPRLDLTMQTQFTGLDGELGDSYGNATDDQFVSYLVGLSVEQPIGNREAEANYRAARLRRLQSVISYQQVIQLVTREIKDSLRDVRLNYDLLVPTRDARLAAAENLRTIEVKEEFQAALTPEFLNLKFNRQEALALAELEEARAIAEYQISLSNLYAAMGVILDRNQINFVVPEFE
ncbi:MAG: TolC family protein [Phycisphaerales bacterium]